MNTKIMDKLTEESMFEFMTEMKNYCRDLGIPLLDKGIPCFDLPSEQDIKLEILEEEWEREKEESDSESDTDFNN